MLSLLFRIPLRRSSLPELVVLRRAQTLSTSSITTPFSSTKVSSSKDFYGKSRTYVRNTSPFTEYILILIYPSVDNISSRRNVFLRLTEASSAVLASSRAAPFLQITMISQRPTPWKLCLRTPRPSSNGPFAPSTYSAATVPDPRSASALLEARKEMVKGRERSRCRERRLTSFGVLWMPESRLHFVGLYRHCLPGPVTDTFYAADIKYKCLIHSKDAGSIMVIPREAGLVRFYVQLQSGADRSKQTQDICINTAKKIFEPYELEFGYVDWFSVYQIGQRIASNYTLDERVFLGGDATHTHSPKAGQGMNISMLDMYTLAWKINLVEKGIGKRDVILPTYEQERRGVAQELLRFDAEYSRLFSGRSPKSDQLTADAGKATKSANAVDSTRFIEVFKRNAFFTSGCGAVYFSNAFNALPESEIVKSGKRGNAFNPEGCKLIVGQRLLPGKAVRCEDANQIRIQQE